MTDDALATALNIPVNLVPKIEPEKRAVYERLIDVADRLNRGEDVPGVIVCRPHRRRPI